MVKLEEVPDEELNLEQPGPKLEEEDDWDTDDESVASDVSEADSDLDETLYDRIAALKDIVPPEYRTRIQQATDTGVSWLQKSARFTGSSLWILSTSAMLLGIPWALAFSEEQQVQEMEREMRMQQSANELLTQSAGQTGAKPAL
ncbi:Hypothetical protein R9X50_00479800 [Acrodontium crateriforme]|uniref:Mitochondrial import receptor subunit tom22 n=1 Tax=Acrodontium crateriforme TaxID=150365 RepID=A0AAQ3M5Z1_9PEZI|nr:Hypothetical protein R9X50_00479800 [Acrodontium crateriforme]